VADIFSFARFVSPALAILFLLLEPLVGGTVCVVHEWDNPGEGGDVAGAFRCGNAAGKGY